MQRIRLTDPNHPLFATAWRLYKESFPVDERRRLSSQRRILQRPAYHFDVVIDHSYFIAILLWWEFDNLRYVEHLAVVPTLRGMQHGERILRRFLSESDTPVWLEVELPKDELRQRRIDFYRRVGFVLNHHPYLQPAYEKSTTPVPLLVMTHPTAVTESDVRFFSLTYHPLLTDYSKHRASPSKPRYPRILPFGPRRPRATTEKDQSTPTD